MRIGKIERQILLKSAKLEGHIAAQDAHGNLYFMYHDHHYDDHGYDPNRTTCTSIKWGQVPILLIRNEIFFFYDRGAVTPADKATFSRAIRKLKQNGLIETYNHHSGKQSYVTHIKLAREGQALVNRIKRPIKSESS